MIMGLPIETFIFIFVIPLISIILAFIYAVTFDDSDDWWTIDRLFKSSKNPQNKEDSTNEKP